MIFEVIKMTCQEKLQDYSSNLEKKVNERTKQLDKKIKEKFGYSTREEKPEVSVEYVPNPLRDPPLPSYIPPRFFPFFRF